MNFSKYNDQIAGVEYLISIAPVLVWLSCCRFCGAGDPESLHEIIAAGQPLPAWCFKVFFFWSR
jgi:hypothetical protein